MEENHKTYIAIDLKSFYASVECVEGGLDPFTTNLVVADKNRTEKTICLAVSPALKAYGVPGRPRLFQVEQIVNSINENRRRNNPEKILEGQSYNSAELSQNSLLAVSYIAAPPRMAYYMRYSTDIFKIYLKYIAPEDIHVYSIDEVFMDVSAYLKTYHMTPRQLAEKIIGDVFNSTGITATAGIGTNMYLCKVAMDIEAKHTKPDKNGVRIAELDEMSYRKRLWGHKPITDFWRVGAGYAKKLAENGIYTMGDVARCSLGKPDEYYNEDLLYRLFGVNAELLIDHAWGYEPCTIKEIKAYKPETKSLGSGQVLHCAYSYEKAELVAKEMAELLALDLFDKKLETNKLTLVVCYDKDSLKNDETRKKYKNIIKKDRYGRNVPQHSRGTIDLEEYTASTRVIRQATEKLFEEIVNKDLLIRKIYITAENAVDEGSVITKKIPQQLSLFTDLSDLKAEEISDQKEKKISEAVLKIKKKYGKNAVLKGMNLEDGATAKQRNSQIGGHKA